MDYFLNDPKNDRVVKNLQPPPLKPISDELLFPEKLQGKPNWQFLRDHLQREGRVTKQQLITLVSQCTKLLSKWPASALSPRKRRQRALPAGSNHDCGGCSRVVLRFGEDPADGGFSGAGEVSVFGGLRGPRVFFDRGGDSAVRDEGNGLWEYERRRSTSRARCSCCGGTTSADS